MDDTLIRKRTLTLTVTAVFTAMNVVLSMSIFSIPVPGGHLYANDIVICIASLLLGPAPAFVVGGVGAFLGDFFFYPTPMFVSLVTHGLQAVAISLLSRHVLKSRPALSASIAVAVGAVIMVVGYSLGRAYIYATPEAAILKLPYQIAQAALGAVVSVLVCYTFKFKKIFFRLIR